MIEICAFCGATKPDAQILISGLPPDKPNICDKCVLLCVEILEEKGITKNEDPE